MIVPAGCLNSSVRYFSTSNPFACAVDTMEYSDVLQSAKYLSQYLQALQVSDNHFSLLLLSGYHQSPTRKTSNRKIRLFLSADKDIITSISNRDLVNRDLILLYAIHRK